MGSLARLLWHEKLGAVPVTQLWRVGGNLHVAMALGANGHGVDCEILVRNEGNRCHPFDWCDVIGVM